MKTRNELIELESVSIFQTYKRLPIIVDKAKGCRIYDMDGKVYLDFLGGIAVNALGHGHPKIIAAASNQIKKYMHLSNYYYQEAQILLAEKLKKLTGYSRIFFSNSGTESVEGAIKLVRRWAALNGKKDIISFTGAFHGRTYGALSMMDKPLYKDKMGPFLTDITILPYNDSNKLLEKINNDTAAVFLEFIQGEGGIICANKEFVNTIFELKNQYGFLVVADEIQSGTGRTGKFFGFDHYGVKPDVVTMGKGLGGGLPLGAILAKESLAGVWEKGMHGTTYGGNAVACSTGLVVLEELENGLLNHVSDIGNYLHEKLENIHSQFPEKIKEVRGIGLMKGLLLSFDATILMNKLLEKKIITNAASGTVLRFVPPLIIGKDEIDEFSDGLIEVLNEVTIAIS